MMRGTICNTCGHRFLGDVPDNCPVCHSARDKFSEMDNAIMDPGTEVGESEKKHIPSIRINKECGLVPERCKDVLIRIGEILHPMTPEHSIQWIDVFLDKEFVGRMHLTPKLNPSVVVYLKSEASGKVQVVEFCNIHGAWMSEADL